MDVFDMSYSQALEKLDAEELDRILAEVEALPPDTLIAVRGVNFGDGCYNAAVVKAPFQDPERMRKYDPKRPFYRAIEWIGKRSLSKHPGVYLASLESAGTYAARLRQQIDRASTVLQQSDAKK